jgi:hypothetical protein
MRRLVTVLLAGLVTAGCGVPVDSAPRDLDRPDAVSGSDAPAPDPIGNVSERLYLVRDGKLVRVTRRIPVARTPWQMVQDLVAGPTRDEQKDGLTTALSTMRVGATVIAQRRAAVEIGAPAVPGARSDEVLAYAQIVCTLTSQGAEVGTVSFTRGGKPLAVPSGDGLLSTGPLTIADYADLITS